MHSGSKFLSIAACTFAGFGHAAVACAQEAARDPDEIIVTASTLDLLGIAQTSSQGSLTRQEIAQRPAYRTGQYLESVPGLAVTAHSGEGKANQYLLRGFNLDHGTDFATYVDGVPVNQRTHAHGQGYTDLNFLIPELVSGIDFTKGSYFAAEGDFSAVGSARLRLLDRLPATVTIGAGTLGDRRLFVAGSKSLGASGSLLAALEHFRLDGPWDNPDQLRRYNGVLRWTDGSVNDGVSVTAMGYSGRWNATTDQPVRAIEQGLIGRFGSVDPSDGGRSFRYSLSVRLAKPLGEERIEAELYGVRQILTLWSNFTHFLDDPERGDQHAQNDRRWYFGGNLSMDCEFAMGGTQHSVRLGTQSRADSIRVNLRPTEERIPFGTDRDNRVKEFSVAGFIEHQARWTPWLRTTVALRGDYFAIRDHDLLSGERGRDDAGLIQPKASVALGPWAKTEVYFSAGRGFHSNDARAGRLEEGDGTVGFRRPPLIVRSSSFEAGLRTNIVPHLTASITAFQTDFQSELTYIADVGQTEAGRPSRRRGVEFTGQLRPFPWLELNANLAFNRARYRDGDPATRFIEDAPKFTGAVGVLVDNLGPWSGSLAWRKLGSHPLLDDNSIRSKGYSEINAGIGYKFGGSLSVRADVYNLTNSKDNAADYFYTTRLPGEPPEGVDGLQSHPLEPRSLRVSLTASW